MTSYKIYQISIKHSLSSFLLVLLFVFFYSYLCLFYIQLTLSFVKLFFKLWYWPLIFIYFQVPIVLIWDLFTCFLLLNTMKYGVSDIIIFLSVFFVPSNKKGRRLILNGYSYYKHLELSLKVRWRCSMHARGCRACVFTVKDELIYCKNCHNHPPTDDGYKTHWMSDFSFN